jgi:hypothetical protein
MEQTQVTKIDHDPIHWNLPHWNIHDADTTKKVELRKWFWLNLRDKCERHEYSDESDTPGYIGWYELPGFGPIAFIKETEPKEGIEHSDVLQFDW